MAPTSKDGSRRGNCPLVVVEAVMKRRESPEIRGLWEWNWRASLVPAAAVIPTPRVCVRDAAVKKSVVVAS